MIGSRKMLRRIHTYLVNRDNRLLAQDGPARDTLEGCEHALRHIWLEICAALGERDGDGSVVGEQPPTTADEGEEG